MAAHAPNRPPAASELMNARTSFGERERLARRFGPLAENSRPAPGQEEPAPWPAPQTARPEAVRSKREGRAPNLAGMEGPQAKAAQKVRCAPQILCRRFFVDETSGIGQNRSADAK
jgi:hypothetical protein